MSAKKCQQTHQIWEGIFSNAVFLQLSGTHNDDDKVGSVDAELGPLRAPVLLRVSATSSQVVHKS